MDGGHEKDFGEGNQPLRSSLENLLRDEIVDISSNFGELTVVLRERAI